MSDPAVHDRPIVVGALGGSGTRVLGQILIASGVHLGSNRNDAEDSLTASLLFNRPGWTPTPDEARHRFALIGRLLCGTATVSDRWAVLRAVGGVSYPPLRYRLRYAAGSLRERGPVEGARAWGFKEPNTHLFLPDLAETFTGLRFVYVMRHPLDMAFTANIRQLDNWGGRFGITVPDDAYEVPVAQLDLWLAATTRAVTLGPELIDDRFMTLDYEQLVADPATGVRSLLEFTGVRPDDTHVASMAALVRRPSTMGRYRSEDLSRFRADQLAAVESLGFSV